MKTINIFGRTHKAHDFLIIAIYLLLLVVLAILIWKFVSPILAVIIPAAVAYLLDIRKFFKKK